MIRSTIICIQALAIVVLLSKQDAESAQDAFSRVGKNIYETTIKILKENIDAS
jgi:hypothetical protein|tara:strand:- start:389 stop:547 length:159 start_codon:yes stop_codon:yes gene_type:complete